MAIAQSKITSQGQVSVPAPIRRKLGVGPGSVLEWDETKDGKIIVKRSARVSSEDIHRALYPDGPPRRRTLKELKKGIERYIQEKHARR